LTSPVDNEIRGKPVDLRREQREADDIDHARHASDPQNPDLVVVERQISGERTFGREPDYEQACSMI
jgi:hypothetical protein